MISFGPMVVRLMTCPFAACMAQRCEEWSTARVAIATNEMLMRFMECGESGLRIKEVVYNK